MDTPTSSSTVVPVDISGPVPTADMIEFRLASLEAQVAKQLVVINLLLKNAGKSLQLVPEHYALISDTEVSS